MTPEALKKQWSINRGYEDDEAGISSIRILSRSAQTEKQGFIGSRQVARRSQPKPVPNWWIQALIHFLPTPRQIPASAPFRALSQLEDKWPTCRRRFDPDHEALNAWAGARRTALWSFGGGSLSGRCLADPRQLTLHSSVLGPRPLRGPDAYCLNLVATRSSQDCTRYERSTAPVHLVRSASALLSRNSLELPVGS